MFKFLRDQLRDRKGHKSNSETPPFAKASSIINEFKKATFTILMGICLLTFSNTANAQNGIAVSSLKKDASTSEWHLYKQLDGVKISYQYVDCGPVGNIFFKVENTTAKDLTISWKYKFLKEKRELDINPDDAIVAFDLKGNSKLTGGCNISGNKLKVFAREGNSPFRITELDLSNLTVSQVK